MTARSFTDETAARASGNPPGAGPPPVRRRVVVWLVLYGLLLFEIAVAAVMYNPVSGQFGFNAAAKTALISGGVCGGLSLLWAFLLWRGARWPLIGAVMSTTLFLAAFSWRATVAWTAFAGGASEKAYAASLISLMGLASLALIVLLLRERVMQRNRTKSTTGNIQPAFK